LGWDNAGGHEEFSAEELAFTHRWLVSKTIAIAGGTSEIQLNIIAKRVLGLPDWEAK
jgi:alkylation response protein AidB-like acyl-CoA dehydrogenase